MGTNINLCRIVVRDGMKQEELLDNFCSTCALSEKNDSRNVCEYFLRMTKTPMKVPSNYLVELDRYIESQGLPGLIGPSFVDHKITIQAKAIEMWNLYANQADASINDIFKLWFVENMGNGNTSSDAFDDLCTGFMHDVIEYNSSHEHDVGLARDVYLIYRYCERMYWLSSIGTYDIDMQDGLEGDYYTTVEKAEKHHPIADYRSMVNTYRLSNNMSLYTEYLDILKPSSGIELDDTVNAWLHAHDEEAERGPTNERNPF
jgi:hypothetical protein